MTKTIALKPFDIHSLEKDVVTVRDYSGDRSSIAFKRQAPKRIKDFPGMEKSETKYTLTGIGGTLIGIVTISTSIRADADAASRTDLLVLPRAVIDDDLWTQLVTDQRLPTTV